MSRFGIVRKVWSSVERLVLWLLIALFVAMIAACLAQVIWRYIFANPLVWSEELARYLFIWISYLSAWLAWKYRAHIALDAVTMLAPPRILKLSVWLVEAIILAFCLYTLPAGFQIVSLTQWQPSAVLELPMSYVYVAYSLMAVMIAADILVGWISPAPIPTLSEA